MGQKVSPTAFRVGITNTWSSRWFLRRQVGEALQQDAQIRDFLARKFSRAGITRLEIERVQGGLTVNIHTTRPGMIIGKGGAGVEEIRKRIRKEITAGQDVRINIEEVRKPELSAMHLASAIAEQLEKRVAFRRAMKQAIESSMQSGAQGVRVNVSGRLNGAEIARREWLASGKLPLHTLRADIDFARATAFTTYGTIGVKVWVYKGEIFEQHS